MKFLSAIRRRWTLVAFTCALGLASGSARADLLDDIKARGTLIVGGKSDYKPFGFREGGGEPVGFSVDLAKSLAETLGVKLQIVPTQAANQLEFLQQGKVDVLIAAMNDTEARRKVVRIIEPGYYASGANVLLIKAAHVTDWDQLKDKTLCGNQGAYFNRPAEERYGAKVVAFKSPTEAYGALLHGSCIGFLYDDNSLMLKLEEPQWSAYEMPLQSIMPQPVAMAVRLGEEKFAALLTQVSGDWYRTGYIRKLEEAWFPGRQSSFVAEMAAKYK